MISLKGKDIFFPPGGMQLIVFLPKIKEITSPIVSNPITKFELAISLRSE
tara:strand:- start:93 stop:242 length:150 start_codon:yes stop_codon:yes gene_type:complete